METYLPMNTGVFLDPSVSGVEASQRLAELSDEYHLTSVDYQQIQDITDASKAKMIKFWREDDLLLDKGDPINEEAKRFAETWYQWGARKNDAELYKEIELGALFVHTMTYYFVGLFKAITLIQQFIKISGVTKLIYVGAESVWLKAAQAVCESLNVDFVHIAALPIKQELSISKAPMKKWLKGVVEKTVRKRVGHYPTGGVLFSSTMKFVQPIMKAIKGEKYYLREEFSWEAHTLAKECGFHHLRTEYFYETTGLMHETLAQAFLESIKTRMSEVVDFKYEGIDIWGIVQCRLDRLTKLEVVRAIRYIDAAKETLKQLQPKAIFVDEDVCLFNKILVCCANQLAIPTYVLAHGVPYFKVGFAPLSAHRILVWGESSKDRLKSWGILDDRIEVTGAPHYVDTKIDQVSSAKEAVLRKLNMDSWSKVLTLATQPFHSGDKPDFVNTPLTPNYIDLSIQLFGQSLSHDRDLLGVIKLHPRDEHIAFTQDCVRKLPEDIQARVVISKEIPIAELIQASDLVLTMGSTVYYEALLYDAPAMLIDDAQHRFFEFMSQKFVDVGSPVEAGQEVAELLKNYDRESLVASQQENKMMHFIDDNMSVLSKIQSMMERDLVGKERVGTV